MAVASKAVHDHETAGEVDRRPTSTTVSSTLCCSSAGTGRGSRSSSPPRRPRRYAATRKSTSSRLRSWASRRRCRRRTPVASPSFRTQPPGYYSDDAAAAALGMAPVISGVQQSEEWACTSDGAWWPAHHGSFVETPNCGEEQAGASPGEAWFADGSLPDDTIHLPLSPDDPHFAQVYRFIGDVFGSGEAQLQRLQGMDPVVVETILLVLRNLEANLSA